MDNPQLQESFGSQPLKAAESEEKVAAPVIRVQGDDPDADSLLLWLVKYPVSFNHPRPLTQTIEVQQSGEVLVVPFNASLPTLFKQVHQ